MIQRTILNIIAFMAICSSSAISQIVPNTQYFYDDLGRLTKVVDQSGNVAIYSYDAVGNILRISRTTLASNALSILNFTPSQGGVGTSVTIQGQGFSATPSQNSVAFNGTLATVVSATTSTIVATVPNGASTGPITVTVNGQPATSENNFIVIPAPAILSVAPASVVSSAGPMGISNFAITGANLGAATFVFQPVTTPPQVAIGSVNVDPSGNSATLNLAVAANVSGAFTLVATNASGSSSQVPSVANTLHILNPSGDDDNDGLTNAVEIAIGTDPLNASTAGDGISDGWKVFYGFNPLTNIASQDTDGDGLTNLQEFQAGTNPRNPDTAAPAVSQVFPANLATAYPLNGKVVVRFTEPLLTGVNLSAAQSAINAVAPSLPGSTQTTAASVLQAYLQSTCCGNSITSGVVTLTQGSTPVSGTIKISNDSLSLTFYPALALTASTVYTVQANTVRDLAGNRMTAQFQSSFTTGTTNDLTGPTIVQTSPASGATNVPTNSAFTVQFSKRIDPATLSTQAFTVSDNQIGGNVPGTVQVDASGLTAAFIPNPPFSIGRSFSARLDTTQVKDTSGNALAGTSGFSFTTAFAPDNDVPHLIATSPLNNDVNIPTNAVIVLQFNEPLNNVAAGTGVQVLAGGTAIQGGIALSDSNRRITFTPAAALTPNSSYTVSVQPSIADLADRLIDNPGTFTFQTGAGTDTTRPSVVTLSPLNGAGGVPVNSVIEAQFSERINPLTVNGTDFTVTPSNGLQIPGTIVVSSDGLSATFTPSAPLLTGTNYSVFLSSSITDLTGQALIPIFSSFTTGMGTQGTGPGVVAVSPANGSSGVQANAKVMVQLNEPVEPLSVGSNAIVLSAGGTGVSGSISLSTDRSVLTFTPSSLLAASTVYTVTASGFEDVAGNPVTPFTSSFTTGTSAVADTTALTVSSVSPANNLTGVPVNSAITLNFNKAVNPTTVNTSTVQVLASGFSGQLAGSYSVSGNMVTFTPTTILPANTRITVQVLSPLQDVAGNLVIFFNSSFTTGAGADTVAPQVVSVTPSDGASNIGQNVAVVLTFSKSINPATVTASSNGTVGLLDGSGVPLSRGVTISADNRTVTLVPGSTPTPGTVVTVIATSGVKDLAGNALADFRSQFTVAQQFDTTHALVTSQRPGNGATGVSLNSSVVLYVNETLNTGTVPGALHVSQNGVLVSGTVTVRDNGQTIQFVPAGPWQKNAFIQVFLDSTALDSDGNTVTSYQGSFRTVVDTTTVTPQILSLSPASNSTAVPLNPVVEWQYNEPLNPSTVNTNTVLLQNANTGQFVAGTVTLDSGGAFIRFVPTVGLLAATPYNMQTTGIIGSNGLAGGFTSSRFTTGSATDTTAPVVTLVAPPDNAANVPVNAIVHVRFNEPVNPLTVSAGTIQLTTGTVTSVASSISFSNNNQDVILTPQDPLPDNTAMTIKVTGVEDLAGNQVVVKNTAFTTGAGPAAVQPQVVNENPFSNATNVPLNTLITLQSNVPVDPGSVNTGTFTVNDNTVGGSVAGNTSVSADGMTINFLPSAPLGVSRNYSVFFSNRGITDLAGNLLACCNFSFTASPMSNSAAPTVLGVSPANQLTSVPINAQVVIKFSEPVDALTLGQVMLSGPSGNVNAAFSLSNGQTMLILTPVVPLIASTQYTLSIAGVQDLSGNVMTSPVSATFTTGPGADLTRPSVTTVSPANGATLVAVNTVITVQFSKRIDPLTVSTSTFTVTPSGGTAIAGSVVVSADFLSATFTPGAPLLNNKSYSVNVSSGVTDLTGQALIAFFSSFTTTP
jgi:large repetitive protein